MRSRFLIPFGIVVTAFCQIAKADSSKSESAKPANANLVVEFTAEKRWVYRADSLTVNPFTNEIVTKTEPTVNHYRAQLAPDWVNLDYF